VVVKKAMQFVAQNLVLELRAGDPAPVARVRRCYSQPFLKRKYCGVSMKPAVCLTATVALVVLWSIASGAAEVKKKKPASRIARSTIPTAQMKLLATRTMLIDRMKASRQELQNSVPLYEEKLAQQSAECEARQKRINNEEANSRTELENCQMAMANARLELQRVREWIAEDDLSLSLAENAEREKSAQVARLNPGEYRESATLIRYEGISSWSLAGVEKIAKFFHARFGERLPVSALGQSTTHDRMGLDHRDAVDVAVQPDSAEGRALINFLKTNGIPFMAFRSRILGMSTGAHIHIGRPSPRLQEVKQRSTNPGAPDKNAVRG
jgi:hypothetical protein